MTDGTNALGGDAIKTSLVTGFASNFRTGSMVVDLLIVTIFSSLIGLVFSSLPTLLNEKLPTLYAWLIKKVQKPDNVVVIRYTCTLNKYGDWNAPSDEQANYHLIEAVQARLKKVQEIQAMDLSLSGFSKDSANSYVCMKTKEFQATPTSEIETDGMRIIMEKNSTGGNDDGGRQNNTAAKERALILTIKSKKSSEDIRKFIEECYYEYVEYRYSQYNVSKKNIFYYIPESEPEENTSLTVYNRYALRTSKNFDNTFFPNKDEVVRIIDNFLTEGEEQRHKLSFLLYGVPGCGKTSFIKALANKTNRSVINVRLGSIRSNQELLMIFHELQIHYNSYTNGQKIVESSDLKMNERIFIFEDIDADAAEIVKRRNKPTEALDSYNKDFDMPKEQQDDQEKDMKDFVMAAKSKLYPSTFKAGPRDPVNLSGLLNVLDGMLELPGAIVVMTSNHPEKLDPALIRPGRITMKIHFGKMEKPEIKKLLCHCFHMKSMEKEDAISAQKWEIELDGKMKQIEGALLTPAAVEACCQTSESLDQAITQIAVEEANEKQRIARLEKEKEKLLRESMSHHHHREPIKVDLRISCDDVVQPHIKTSGELTASASGWPC